MVQILIKRRFSIMIKSKSQDFFQNVKISVSFAVCECLAKPVWFFQRPVFDVFVVCFLDFFVNFERETLWFLLFVNLSTAVTFP